MVETKHRLARIRMLPGFSHHTSGHANHRRMCWNGGHNDTTGTHTTVAPDCYRAKDRRAQSHDDEIFDRGMALALAQTGSAQTDTLVDQYIITDNRGLADDNAHAVIDETTRADRGSGMDLDAGQEPGHRSRQPRQQAEVATPKSMRGTMPP